MNVVLSQALWFVVDLVAMYYTIRLVGRKGLIVFVGANLLGFVHGLLR